MDNKFAERFKGLRLERGLSQAAAAKLFYVSQKTISCWELGKQEPNLSLIVLITQKFGVTMDYLIGLKDY